MQQPLLFDTHQKLGPLELAAMKIIWKKEKCTVGDVLDELHQEKPLAYTTVMTVMDHLYKKGFVERVKVKKTYFYTPLVLRNRLVRTSLSRVFGHLMSEYGKIAVLTSLVPSLTSLPAPRLNPRWAFYKTPVITGFLASLVLGLLVVSLWDIFQNFLLLGPLDYIKLILAEPSIIASHSNLLWQALWESLPVINLSMATILFFLAIPLLRRITRLLDIKFPIFFRIGGSTLR